MHFLSTFSIFSPKCTFFTAGLFPRVVRAELVMNKVNMYSVTCNEVQSQKITFTCNEVHLRCTFENVTKYSYFVICFSALLFFAILLVDVVCILSWRLVEIQPIETTLLSEFLP